MFLEMLKWYNSSQMSQSCKDSSSFFTTACEKLSAVFVDFINSWLFTRLQTGSAAGTLYLHITILSVTKRDFLIISIHKSNPTFRHSTEEAQGVWTLFLHKIFHLECWDLISFHTDVINYAPSQTFLVLNGLFSLEFLYLSQERLLNTL